MSEILDPKKIIDFGKDYYLILGITKLDLPKNQSRQNKLECAKVIESAYRKMARKCHPDFGGSKEQFLDLVRARRILEDPLLKKIYDQGYFDEFNIDVKNDGFNVDWNKVGNYRKGTPEDSIGFNLFFKISSNKEMLNLTPAFFPNTEEHNYEWDWVIGNTKEKLAMSLVSDENEVLRLTSSETIDESLPFKIYICIPQKNLNLVRDKNQQLDPHGKTLINGTINMVTYNDLNLLETTSLKTAVDYINNNLKNDIERYLNGDLKKQFVKSNTNWLDTKNILNFDKKQLENILNMRSYTIVENENADKFLDELDENSVSEENIEKPNLPL